MRGLLILSVSKLTALKLAGALRSVAKGFLFETLLPELPRTLNVQAKTTHKILVVNKVQSLTERKPSIEVELGLEMWVK
jgi:hypothetical protein